MFIVRYNISAQSQAEPNCSGKSYWAGLLAIKTRNSWVSRVHDSCHAVMYVVNAS